MTRLAVALAAVVGALIGFAPSADAYSSSPYCYWYIAGWADWVVPIVQQRCYVL